MRIRSIKPGIWADERIGSLSRDARLLFVGLITLCDDEGRFRAVPRMLVGHCCPYDDDADRKLPRWLDELQKAGLVTLYGEHFGCLPNWGKHQRISHPSPSLLPEPNGNIPESFRNGSGGAHE